LPLGRHPGAPGVRDQAGIGEIRRLLTTIAQPSILASTTSAGHDGDAATRRAPEYRTTSDDSNYISACGCITSQGGPVPGDGPTM
jgi:hypothetical protein